MNIVILLTIKSTRLLYRKNSIRLLVIGSALLTFFGLFIVWLSFNNQILHYMTNFKYTPLSFDFKCSLNRLNKLSHKYDGMNCNPLNEDNQKLTPAKILLNILVSGSLFGANNKNDDQSDEFANLLSSVMMNGLPLIGLSDYIKLSDYVNKELGSNSNTSIFQTSSYSEKFSNLIKIKQKELRIVSSECFPDNFYDFLLNQSFISSSMNVTYFNNINNAMQNCCDNIFAIVILSTENINQCYYSNGTINFELIPSVTIRMQPSLIPDTRNFKWSPRKSLTPKYDTGQLLYFLSGFLSIQLEIQNYISSIGLGGPIIRTDIFKDINIISEPTVHAKNVADFLIRSIDTETVTDSIVHNKTMFTNPRDMINVPLYHRAFPSRQYTKIAFFHTFGSMLAISLILYFSIPSALISSLYRKELVNGQLDMLSTLPLVRHYHSVISYCICGTVWTLLSAILSFVFFLITLSHTSAWLPAIGLFLFGLSLNPLAIIVGLIIKTPEAVAISIPTIVFIIMLPGMLYNDLAYDIQRSIWFEMVISLLPSSAICLFLRHIFGYESLGIQVTWVYPALISNTPSYLYIFMLFFDFILYGFIAILLVDYFENSSIIEITDSTVYLALYNTAYKYLQRVINLVKSFFNFCLFRRSIILNVPVPIMSSYNSFSINDDDNISLFSLTADNITKIFKINNNAVTVLSNLSLHLQLGKVYTLLGSNGAGNKFPYLLLNCQFIKLGKTTLLRILSGLDRKYSGSIKLSKTDNKSRQIGWCPQVNPIFEHLTVIENIYLVHNLLYNKDNSDHDIYNDYNVLLNELDMFVHKDKLTSDLSGGMKRRLALILSFIGNPNVLLLDEPTSSCDSYTRELIRKSLLNRRQNSLIVISTHHLDDIEILSDNVLFLNNQHLIYNDTYFNLYHNNIMDSVDVIYDFSTSDNSINNIFQSIFFNGLPKSNIHGSSKYNYSISKSMLSKFQIFIDNIDNQKMHNYSIKSPSIYSKINNMYGDSIRRNRDSYGNNLYTSVNNRNEESINNDNPTGSDHTVIKNYINRNINSKYCNINIYIKQISAIFRLRLQEIQFFIIQYLFTHFLIPLTVIIIISVSCRDINYPKVELVNSNNYNNEIIISNTKYLPLHFSHDRFIINHDKTSNSLWEYLYNSYYKHKLERTGAFVINDFVPEFIESSVTIDSINFPNMSFYDIYKDITTAKDIICTNNSMSTFNICHPTNPSLIITLVDNFPDNNISTDSKINKYSIVIKSYESLRSNLTLLTNITTDHALPIYLKELVPYIYQNNFLKTNTNGDDRNDISRYKLFNYPLPETNLSNQIYLQRGYVGSIIIIFYLLIHTTNTIKSITNLNYEKVKLLLHMKGLTSFTYLLTNILFDVLLIYLSLLVIFVGLFIGGDPIFSFFSYQFMYLRITLLFSFAIVISNYCYVLLMSDQLSNQLIIFIVTISNSIFLKLYFDRHINDVMYRNISNYVLVLSPVYCITSCLFELFKVHVLDVTMKELNMLSLNQQLSESIHYIGSCIYILTVQSIIYFMIVLLLDRYQNIIYQYIIFIDRILRFYYNTIVALSPWENSNRYTRIIELNRNNINSDLEMSENSNKKLSKDSQLSNSFIKFQGIELLKHLCPGLNVGLFPVLSVVNNDDNYNNSIKLTSNYSILSDESNDIDIIMNYMKPNKIGNRVGNNNLVDISNLYIEYTNANKLAIKDLSLSFSNNEKIALMGMNGGGKSTLFKSLSIDSNIPLGGNIRFDNQYDSIRDQWMIYYNNYIGYVPQDNCLLLWLTVYETIYLFYSTSYESQNQYKSFDDLLVTIIDNYKNIVNTTNERNYHNTILSFRYLHYPVYALSGGNKKKLSIILSNIGKPKLLLLDECTSGVDPIASTNIINYLYNEICHSDKYDQSLLFASHRIDECNQLCSRVIIMNDGNILYNGSVNQFDQISCIFYQIDVVISYSHSYLSIINYINGNDYVIDRIVVYSNKLLRLTFSKNVINISDVWNKLIHLEQSTYIDRFYFREMNMEEALSSIISSSIEQNQN